MQHLLVGYLPGPNLGAPTQTSITRSAERVKTPHRKAYSGVRAEASPPVVMARVAVTARAV